jgi:hypothetical protein
VFYKNYCGMSFDDAPEKECCIPSSLSFDDVVGLVWCTRPTFLMEQMLIWSKVYEKQLLSVLETTCKCISTDPRLRPSIEEVVSWLDRL